ncbi:MAG TPA: ABC transporter permease [Dinghuibacter sp.]|uniref:ABC transporter permease n=1 Tax=Dinghuibacter sp. TaxID=2024697 RepID=UPI002B7247FE|nr:ABC transporter permease [Dinghuibacter sp.]HTJ14291.1 ABC transporter permease [Dinghuibacter sp.]
MIRNYIKTALRALWRKKTFTFLNVLGLSVGLGACMVLFLIIRYELSFDTFHSKKDRIYRVLSAWKGGPEGMQYSSGVPIPMTPAIRSDMPQFSEVAATWSVGGGQFTIPGKGVPDKKFVAEGRVLYTEPGLFRIFDFPWLAGDPSSLNDPNTMAIEQAVAEKWFGNWQDAIGKTVILNHTHPFVVTGVMKDHVDNTDVPVSIALSYASFNRHHEDDWHDVNSTSNCYALLAPGQTIQNVNTRIPAFDKLHFVGEDKSIYHSTIEFQPLSRMHFDTRPGVNTYSYGTFPPSRLWALALIGLFLLLVACVNFINLATAQSVSRSKEIGVRKVLGSSKGSLVRQFLGETAMISFTAVVLGCILAEIGASWMGKILELPLSLNVWRYPSILLFVAAAFVVITFLSGFYPGLVLSRFNPVEAIKSRITPKTVGGLPLRRVLVVFQFAIAQVLVIGTLVVVKQMNYFDTIPLGFDKNAVAMVDIPSDSLSQQKHEYLKQLIKREPGVVDASLCSTAPSSGWVWDNGFTFENRPQPETWSLAMRMTDTDYYRTFHIDLVAGRLPYPSDTAREYVLNETAVRKLGFTHPTEILGKVIHVGKKAVPIVGVVRDFHSTSLQQELSPMAMSTTASVFYELAVRLDPNRIGATMKRIQADWESVYPAFMYHSVFLDEDMAQYYEDEEQTSKLFHFFAGIAIFISCLGLYGLVSFMAVQRTKEVGIRKVLGASVRGIVVLFSREFTILVVIAFLVAAPLGYYVMRQWLNGFFYRANMGWGIFALSIGGSLVIAWATVGYKAIRAALANPIQSLRTE